MHCKIHSKKIKSNVDLKDIYKQFLAKEISSSLKL